MEQKYLITLLDKQSGRLNTFDMRTGELLSCDGVVVSKSTFGYSLEIGDAICNLIREGWTITKLAQRTDMPQSHVIHRWIGIHPEFRKMVEVARADRGSYNLDKAQAIVDETELITTRDELAVQKFKFDGYVKLAEKDNPKLADSRQGAAPLQIVVNTGILREQPITVEANGQTIDIGREQRVGDGRHDSLQDDQSDGADERPPTNY